MKKKWVLTFQIAISVFLLGKAIAEMSLHLDCDELGIVADVQQKNPLHPYLNFLHPSKHTLASAFTIGSLKLFGVDPLISRIPAILFTIIFLALLGYVCHSYLSVISTLLLYLHFLTNESANWYFHSSRGYVYMMLISLATLLLIWQSLNNPKKKHTAEYISLGLLFVLSVLNHHFSVVTFAIYCLAVAAWAALNWRNLNTDQRSTLKSYLRLSLGFLPFILLIGAASIYYHSGIERVFPKYGPENPINLKTFFHPFVIVANFMGALGVFRTKWLFYLLGITGVLLIIQRRTILNDSRLNYLWLVCGLFLLAFTFMSGFAQINTWSGRYLMACPLVFLIAVGESINKIKSPATRTALLFSFLLIFAVVPLFESSPQLVTNLCDNDYIFQPYFKRWFQ